VHRHLPLRQALDRREHRVRELQDRALPGFGVRRRLHRLPEREVLAVGTKHY
jgi:hypothetical protein